MEYLLDQFIRDKGGRRKKAKLNRRTTDEYDLVIRHDEYEDALIEALDAGLTADEISEVL